MVGTRHIQIIHTDQILGWVRLLNHQKYAGEGAPKLHGIRSDLSVYDFVGTGRSLVSICRHVEDEARMKVIPGDRHNLVYTKTPPKHLDCIRVCNEVSKSTLHSLPHLPADKRCHLGRAC